MVCSIEKVSYSGLVGKGHRIPNQSQDCQISHPGSEECELSNREEEEGVRPLLHYLNADCRKQSCLSRMSGEIRVCFRLGRCRRWGMHWTHYMTRWIPHDFWAGRTHFALRLGQTSSFQSTRVAYSDHSSSPLCGFSKMGQVRLWPQENWLGTSKSTYWVG